MREIKFRGRKMNDDQWIYGHYYKKINDFTLGSEPKIHVIVEDGNNYYKVREETLGEYTGLKDKNGKEIYEGDIVKCVNKNDNTVIIAVVEFGNPNCGYDWGWQLKQLIGDRASLDILLWIDMEDVNVFCELIGNIHDYKGE